MSDTFGAWVGDDEYEDLRTRPEPTGDYRLAIPWTATTEYDDEIEVEVTI